MRKLLPFFLLLIAVPMFADSDGRAQSYFTFDDGGTMIRQGDDGKEVEAQVNFPVYAGDEITTSRRGRAEIRLSDGNVIALDRGTQIRLGGVRDAYDNDGNSQTVIELHYGHIMIERDGDDREPVRLDTENASFAATERAIYAVDTEHDKGAIRVFDGSVEVRTPSRTTRVRSGEEGRLDDQGLYDLVSLGRGGADDFERWFLGRSEVYRRGSSRYLDRNLAYAAPELDRYGSWVYVADYGSWCWRPVVMSAGWRPYYNGFWHHGRGGSVWVGYDPWGWVPYHYGRWSFAPSIGWVWLPGGGYSPAWVYWMYGPGYVGWAPAGWYDCYGPYYGWAYRPYARIGFNFGFYGRVRLHDIDLRPWTFVEPGHFIGRHIERVALGADVVRSRFGRENGGYATVSGATARFSRAELRDPASAINNMARRGASGREMNGGSDMTPFFRRDANLSAAVREHIVRSRAEVAPAYNTPRGVGSGIPTPGTGGTLEGRVPRDGGGYRGSENPSGVPGSLQRGGTVGGAVGDWRNRDNAGTARRGSDATTTTTPSTTNGTTGRDTSTWRNRDNGNTRRGGDTTTTTPSTERSTVPPSQNNGTVPPARGGWRDRTPVNPPNNTTNPPSQRELRDTSGNRDTSSWRNNGGGTSRGSVRESTPRSNDVPRRIIDSVGGARIYSGDRGSRSSGNSGGGNSGGGRSYTPPPSHSNGGGSSSGGSHSSSSGSSHHSGGGEHKKN